MNILILDILLMKKLHYLIAFAILLKGFGPTKETDKIKLTTKGIVLIGLDGISIDGYQNAGHPYLDQLMSDGEYVMSCHRLPYSIG